MIRPVLKRGIGLAWLMLILLAKVGGAQEIKDGVASTGKLSDENFYRLVACGAEPGKECSSPFVRWKYRSITYALLPPDPAYPKALADKISKQVDIALAEINRQKSGLTLTRADHLGRAADVLISLPNLIEGQETKGIPNFGNDQKVGVGLNEIAWDGGNSLYRAGILFTKDLSERDMPSVVLEEIFQSLGFPYDIENPYYTDRSILSQDSNDTVRIEGQDTAALLRHYPRTTP